jgi:Rieske Fe-S protein
MPTNDPSHGAGDDCALDCPLGASVPSAHGRDRRTFLARAAVAAAAVALAACGAGGDATAPFSGTFSFKVGDHPELASVNGVALITANGSRLAVVRTGATTFVALSRVCPHEGSTINATSTGFLCPNHGATFDRTGTWIGGQRTSSMRSYATSYDASTDTLTIG